MYYGRMKTPVDHLARRGGPTRSGSDIEAVQAQFERNAIWNRMVTAGDRLPDMALIEADLGLVHLHRLRHTGPVVLVFFSYVGSVRCEAALRRYRDRLEPALVVLNAHLVAVSPQVPERLRELKRRLDLGFLVASDPRHALIDRLNIGFEVPGADTVLGAGRAVLPFATVVVADRAGFVRHVDVRGDWASPTDPQAIIRVVEAMESRRRSATG